MIKNILNLGDAALYCDFGSDVNQEINSNVIKYFYHIKKLNLKGITNLTPSYNKLIISYDLNIHSFLSLKKKIENIEIKENNKLEKNLKISCARTDTRSAPLAGCGDAQNFPFFES